MKKILPNFEMPKSIKKLENIFKENAPSTMKQPVPNISEVVDKVSKDLKK